MAPRLAVYERYCSVPRLSERFVFDRLRDVLLRARPTDWKGTNKLSLWVAIDDATVSNGCLKVVPESHGHVFPHEQHTEAIAFDSRVNGASISDEQMSVPLEAGSVLFFHDLLLHASNPNTNGKDRYCMIPTYRSVEDNDPVRIFHGSQALCLPRRS